MTKYRIVPIGLESWGVEWSRSAARPDEWEAVAYFNPTPILPTVTPYFSRTSTYDTRCGKTSYFETKDKAKEAIDSVLEVERREKEYAELCRQRRIDNPPEEYP